MITQHNMSAINSCGNLGINQSALSKNLEKLPSGYKTNRAGDNVTGLTTSESMRFQTNGLSQASANAKNAIGLTETAEGALSEVRSMLQRMTTLVEQAVNGTYNTVARGNVQEEYKVLTKEIKCISENADFDGIKSLTMGKEMTMTFQIGPTLGETVTINKKDIYGKAVTAVMSSKPLVQSDVKNALKTIKTAIDDVSTYCARLGATQDRLEHTVKSLNIMSENTTEAESCIHGTDMVDEIIASTKNNTLLQAARPMSAQSNAAPQGILSLL